MKRVIFAAVVFLASAASYGAPVTGSVEFQAAGSPGALTITGKGGKLTGDVTVTGGVATGELTASTGDFDTGLPTRDTHTKEKLEAVAFPTAKLVLKPWKVTDKDSDFEGDLTIKGVTKPVKGKASVAGKSLHAVMTVKASDYAIGPVKYLGIGVKDEVVVTVNGITP